MPGLLDELRERSLSLWQMSLLSLYTGLRAGEVFHLRWEHVNFTAGTITVMDSKNAMNRVVHMPEQVKDMLAEHQVETKGQAGRLVFPKAGTQNTPHHQISPGFRLILRDTKLNEGITDPRDKVVFHTLRHTYASWLVQAGVPLYTVQRLMGHKSIIMTQRYAHLAPDQGGETARLLSGIKLNGESSSCYEARSDLFLSYEPYKDLG